MVSLIDAREMSISLSLNRVCRVPPSAAVSDKWARTEKFVPRVGSILWVDSAELL